MDLDKRIAHERLLRMLPVRTVVRLIDPPDQPARASSEMNLMESAADRERRMILFMKPGIRYTAFELGGAVGIEGNLLWMMLDRMVKRGRLQRRGAFRRWKYSRG